MKLSSNGELFNDMICMHLSTMDLDSYYEELMNATSNDYVEFDVIKINAISRIDAMSTTVNEENNSVGTNRKSEFVIVTET